MGFKARLGQFNVRFGLGSCQSTKVVACWFGDRGVRIRQGKGLPPREDQVLKLRIQGEAKGCDTKKKSSLPQDKECYLQRGGAAA
jgi:hypothetical protein